MIFNSEYITLRYTMLIVVSAFITSLKMYETRKVSNR